MSSIYNNTTTTNTTLHSPDLLRTILPRLSLPDLARAACVCRPWNSVASEREIKIKAFMSPWKLMYVVGYPTSVGFWRESGLGKFAISHRVKRGDSVASLAVNYSVQVMDIKRLNNLMSDHEIFSRERLLIPVSNADILINATCYIEIDAYAKREVAVLYLDGGPDRSSFMVNDTTSYRGHKRMPESSRRSMQVDDGFAPYYFSLSNGDPQAALTESFEDLWGERQVGCCGDKDNSLSLPLTTPPNHPQFSDTSGVYNNPLPSSSSTTTTTTMERQVGCCVDEGHSLSLPLTTPPNYPHFYGTSGVCNNPLHSFSFSTITTTIAPFNSNLTPLDSPDLLHSILSHLPLPDLARAACVCRFWNSVASDREIQIKAFMSPWKLKDVVGNPSNGGFWRDNGLGRFAISHRVKRGDSVASLAVKYSVQVMDIKRLNNMLSDHGIFSRERLLIPVSNSDILVNATCYIEIDALAKREVAMLYLEGGPDRSVNSMVNNVTSDRGQRRVLESLRRSMQVDDGTAQYYFALSNGDPRAALTEFSEDLRWERQAGLA